MAPGGYYDTTTAITVYLDCGSDWTTGTSSTYVIENHWGHMGRRYDVPTYRPTRKELAQMKAQERAAMFPRPIEKPIATVDALNAGMHIRRMRASTGLARGRA